MKGDQIDPLPTQPEKKLFSKSPSLLKLKVFFHDLKTENIKRAKELPTHSLPKPLPPLL